jgi:hypothetical protein
MRLTADSSHALEDSFDCWKMFFLILLGKPVDILIDKRIHPLGGSHFMLACRAASCDLTDRISKTRSRQFDSEKAHIVGKLSGYTTLPDFGHYLAK